MQTTSDIPPLIPATPQRVGLSPVSPAERIEALDVLRGFALFGILCVNMLAFSWPTDQMMPSQQVWRSTLDAVADWLVRFLAEGKFYPLFALLFGLGAAIQMGRAETHGTEFTHRFCRRLLALLGIGLAHALLLWEGDILVWYALCGFPLLAFRQRKPRTLLIWAVALLLVPALLIGFGWALLAGVSLVPEIGGGIERELAKLSVEAAQASDETIRVFAHGSYGEIFLARLENLLFMWMAGFFYVPGFLGMFLLGMYAGRRRIVHDPEINLRLLRRVVFWGVVIGLPVNLLHAIAMATSDFTDPRFLWLLSQAFVAVGGPAQTLAYAAAIVLLLRHRQGQRLARFLAAAGRMALTNYLMQSLICTTIFYSYGLGWFGSVGRAAGIGLAVIIFGAQVLFSHWWLKRFRFGPMEWFWRTITYGKRPAMRI